MKKNLTIVTSDQDMVSPNIILSRADALLELSKIGTYDFINNYKISEDFILENHESFEKDILIQGLDLSEDFIIKALDIKYFTTDDISGLNMSTCLKLSDVFIKKYKDSINWSKMVLYAATQSDDFDDSYIKIIDNNNLWSLISANDLPIDFIREWKDKLDWTYLSMVKEFTDGEKVEFSDYIKYNQFKAIEVPEFGFGSLNYQRITIDQLDEMIYGK